jgi:hypothetical protein
MNDSDYDTIVGLLWSCGGWTSEQRRKIRAWVNNLDGFTRAEKSEILALRKEKLNLSKKTAVGNRERFEHPEGMY